MSRPIGDVRHEALRVTVESYNGDWEDHTIHLWGHVWRGSEAVYGIHADDGSVLEQAVFTLTRTEALDLIALLARAVREA